MKTFNIISKIFVSLLLLGSFAVSGWGAAANSPIVSLTCNPNPITEGNSGVTQVTCRVSIDVAPNKRTLRLTIKTTNGTATTANSDYISLNSNFTFSTSASPLYQDFTVDIKGDTTNEQDETFSVSVIDDGTSSSQPFTLPNNQTITITNNDATTPTTTPIGSTTTDLCYDDPNTELYSIIPPKTKDIIPIRYVGDGTTLSDVVIEYAISGIDMSFNQDIGIDATEKTLATDSDEAELSTGFSTNFGTGMPNFSAFNTGIKYHLGSMSTDSLYETWTGEFIMTAFADYFFSSTKIFAEYTKNGQAYRTIVNPCSGNTKTVPTVSIADASMSSPATDTVMPFTVTLSGSLSPEFGAYSYIHYKTVDGTAHAGTDYTAVDGTLVVPEGTTSATIDVTIKAGASLGSFYVILDNAYAASIVDGNATGTITAPTVTKPDAQCGIFPSVLTSYDSITVSGNNAQVCSEQDLAYPTTGSNLGSLQCNASGCGNGACSRIDPPNIQYTVTFPTLPIASTTLSSDQTLTPTQTYSGGTSHEYSTFGDTIISGASGRTITFTAGDYYFNSLTLPDNNSQIIISGGAVRIFVKNNLTFNGNSFEINKNGLAGNLFIYVGGDLSFAGNGGGNGGMNAYFYTEGTTIVNNNTNNFQLTGGITSEGPINITGNNPSFLAYTLGAGNGYGDCNTPIDYTLTGPFDAWDTFRSVSDRNISTKIVNTAFNLTVAALNSAKTGLEAKASGVKARYRLLNTNTAAYLTNEQIFDANATASITSSFNAASASKNVKVEFKYCADYDGTHFILKDDTSCTADCSSQLKVTNNNPCFRKTYSTDAFALRPYALKVFGTNQYKRAGEDFNITIKAVDEANYALNNSGNADTVSGVSDYNDSLSNLDITSMFYTPTAAEMSTMQGHTGLTDVAICPASGTFTLVNHSALFIDGEQNATLKFSETGILDLYISETIGHEWALVDADDTNDANRTILPSIESFDKEHINLNTILAFVPYGFETTADYNTTTGADWIYMHDINGSNSTLTTPKMGAYLSYSITAKGKDGNVLQNYTKTCFPDTDDDCPQVNGLKLNTTFDLYLNADINSSADANISLYTEDNVSFAIYTPEKNVTLAKGSNAIQEWTSPKTFTNGVGKAKVYFNIDRKANVALNPITLRVEDVNTSTSWMLNAGSPKDFNGTILNTPKNFVYGRTHAAKQRYIKPDGTNTTTGDANIYFESYCFGAGCDKALLPNGLTSTNVDDIRWFKNLNHSTANDGNVSIVVQKGGANTSADSVTAPDNSTGNPSTAQLIYSGGKGYPYKTTMQNGASPWLIFDENNATATRNEFQVEFSGEASWSGKHETNTTTKTDQSIRTNRRITW